jgi:hypothetical protein
VSGGGEGPAAEYYPGDEINLRVAFSTDSKITAIEVVYAHPSYRWITLTLEGGAEPQEVGGKGGDKRYEATVSGVVEEHHAPGIYSVAGVVFYTFTGRSFAYDRENPRLREDLIEEGVTLPGRWPELGIGRVHREVFDVSVELEPEADV